MKWRPALIRGGDEGARYEKPLSSISLHRRARAGAQHVSPGRRRRSRRRETYLGAMSFVKACTRALIEAAKQ